MSKKIIRIFLIILCIGFIITFVWGYNYHNSKDKGSGEFINISKELSSSKSPVNDESNQQQLGDDKQEEQNITTNTVTSDNYANQEEKQETDTTNTTNNNSPEINNNITDNQNIVKEETKNIETPEEPKNTTPIYIGVPSPNDIFYSYHLGKIEYETESQCLDSAINIAFKDTENIKNTECFQVVDDNGTILGYYLHINCLSGDCNNYKN